MRSASAIFVGVLVVLVMASQGVLAEPMPEDITLDPEEPTTMTMPDLTAAEEQETRDLISNNATLREIVGNIPYTISDVGPWQFEDKDVYWNMGSIALITLANPLSLPQRTWPIVTRVVTVNELRRCDLDCRGYRTGLVSYGVSHATELAALVDLALNRVVEIQPTDNEEVEGTTQLTPPPNEPVYLDRAD